MRQRRNISMPATSASGPPPQTLSSMLSVGMLTFRQIRAIHLTMLLPQEIYTFRATSNRMEPYTDLIFLARIV